MEIPSGKVITKPTVSSLGRLAVMLLFKRRQKSIRVSIEPRYIDLKQEVDCFTLQEVNILY